MAVTTLLRMWKKAANDYCQQSKKLLKKILKELDENKPADDTLDELIEQLGKLYSKYSKYFLYSHIS